MMSKVGEVNIRRILSVDLRHCLAHINSSDEASWDDINWSELPLEGKGGFCKELETHIRIINEDNTAFQMLYNAQRTSVKNHKGGYPDVHLIAEDGKIPVHRPFLKGLSGFLDKQLGEAHGFCKGNRTEIVLADVKLEHLWIFVNILYTGSSSIKNFNDESHVQSILKMLQIEKIKLEKKPCDATCRSQMKSVLTLKNKSDITGSVSVTSVCSEVGTTAPPNSTETVVQESTANPITSGSHSHSEQEPRSSESDIYVPPAIQKVPSGALIRKPTGRIKRKLYDLPETGNAVMSELSPEHLRRNQNQVISCSEVVATRPQNSAETIVREYAGSSDPNYPPSDAHPEPGPSDTYMPPAIQKVPPGAFIKKPAERIKRKPIPNEENVTELPGTSNAVMSLISIEHLRQNNKAIGYSEIDGKGPETIAQESTANPDPNCPPSHSQPEPESSDTYMPPAIQKVPPGAFIKQPTERIKRKLKLNEEIINELPETSNANKSEMSTGRLRKSKNRMSCCYGCDTKEQSNSSEKKGEATSTNHRRTRSSHLQQEPGSRPSANEHGATENEKESTANMSKCNQFKAIPTSSRKGRRGIARRSRPKVHNTDGNLQKPKDKVTSETSFILGDAEKETSSVSQSIAANEENRGYPSPLMDDPDRSIIFEVPSQPAAEQIHVIPLPVPELEVHERDEKEQESVEPNDNISNSVVDLESLKGVFMSIEKRSSHVKRARSKTSSSRRKPHKKTRHTDDSSKISVTELQTKSMAHSSTAIAKPTENISESSSASYKEKSSANVEFEENISARNSSVDKSQSHPVVKREITHVDNFEEDRSRGEISVYLDKLDDTQITSLIDRVWRNKSYYIVRPRLQKEETWVKNLRKEPSALSGRTRDEAPLVVTLDSSPEDNRRTPISSRGPKSKKKSMSKSAKRKKAEKTSSEKTQDKPNASVTSLSATTAEMLRQTLTKKCKNWEQELRQARLRKKSTESTDTASSGDNGSNEINKMPVLNREESQSEIDIGPYLGNGENISFGSATTDSSSTHPPNLTPETSFFVAIPNPNDSSISIPLSNNLQNVSGNCC